MNPDTSKARIALRQIKALYAHIAISRGSVGRFLVLNMLILACQLPTPFVIGRIFTRLGNGEDLFVVLPYVCGAMALMLGTQTLSALAQVVASRAAIAYATSLRASMFEASTEIRGAVDPKVSDLHARFGNDVAAIMHLWPTGLVTNLRHMIALLLAAGALLYLSVPLTLCICGFLPLAVIMFRQFGKRLGLLAAQAQASLGLSNGILLESLHSVQSARPSGAMAFHRGRLLRSLEESGAQLHRARAWSHLMGLALGMLPLFVSGIIWIVGGQRVHAGELMKGDLVAYALVLSVLYAPVNGLFSAASGVLFEAAALQRVLEVFHEPAAESVSAAVPVPGWHEGPASITLRDVSFSYGDRVLFDGLSLCIPAGACALLKGRNGVGKSTLMALIFSAPPLHSERIFLNEVSLDRFAPQGHGALLGYLPQEIMIYSDSLRNNITMGRAVSDEQIMQLARELGLEAFLLTWPGQLDCPILEGGRNLSGGQKQRLGLLRTLVGAPSVLLMDEPDKNLDAQSLASLIDYLRRVKRRCTCVIATHCLAFDSVVDCTVDLSASRA